MAKNNQIVSYQLERVSQFLLTFYNVLVKKKLQNKAK